MERQKRVAAIHDISCFGKCSLTVALPMLSCAGIETCCIPTAVLSTHTGGFSGYTYHDLTADILPIADHWKSQQIQFDAVYTGFLGSREQTDIIGRVLDRIAREDTLVMVDPVMGDDGRLYPVFDESFPAAMRGLCARAHVIVPNMTEAYLLLDEPYQAGPYSEAEIDRLLTGLSRICPGHVVLTGVHFDEASLGAATMEGGTGRREVVLRRKVDGFYHGTGDVYASTLLAALMHDFSLSEAAGLAADYTVLSIETTKAMDKELRYGVNFEYNLPKLMQMLKKEQAQ
ncbi:MAG: pyridoxamine kinase [Ruminococcaceae bacterium]|nr:pyridoxamine kinase [Oscillospiraceae bacterium]